MKTPTVAPSTAIAEYSATEQALAALRQRFEKAVFIVTTTKGMTEAKAARAELRGLRVALEEKRVELKQPVLDRGRLLDGEAKRITAELVALEDPIDNAIKAEEQRKEREKLEREEAERQRVIEINRRFEELKALVLSARGEPVAKIEELITKAEAFDPSSFPEDTQPAARFERQLAINGLKAIRDERAAQDVKDAETAEKLKRLEALEKAEEQRQAREREEQEERERIAESKARQKRDQEAQERAQKEAAEKEALRKREAEIAEQERVAAARRAEEDRKAKEERDRIAAEQAEKHRAEAERQAKERDRQAQERKKLEEEAARLAAEKEAREIANASLIEAATECLPLLQERCPRHKATKKLAAALEREVARKAA